MDKLLCLLEKYRCHLKREDKSSTEFLRENFAEYIKDVKALNSYFINIGLSDVNGNVLLDSDDQNLIEKTQGQ